MAEPLVELPAQGTLRIERMLNAPRETVWRYLIDGELRARWFMGGDTDARQGGSMELTMDHDNLSTEDVPVPEKYAAAKGKAWREAIVAYDPPRLLAIQWDGGKEGVAQFELFDQGETTRLVLTHSGISGPAPLVNFGGGWTSHVAVLEGLLNGNPVRDFWALHHQMEDAVRTAIGEG